MGISPEHHKQLNQMFGASREFYDNFRRIYKEDKVAQQQIDVYDPNSPYFKHALAHRDAVVAGDLEGIAHEESFFRQHYPDISNSRR